MTNTHSENNLHLRFWFFTFIGFGLILWALSGSLLPFILGLAIAYFLDPVVQRISRIGLPRWASALLVLLLFLAILTGITLLLVPVVRAQISDLIHSLPEYSRALQEQIWPMIRDVLEHVPSIDIEKLQGTITQYSGDALGFVGLVLSRVVSSGLAVLDMLALFIFTPIVAFYLMRDFPKIVTNIDGLLPLRHAETIRGELQKVNNLIAGFIRGQAMVSLSLATVYSIGLSLTGLKYGIVIGLISGLLSFIPIVGSVVFIVASLTMAFIQFDTVGGLLAVASVFIFAQMLDGYFLTPKLVGDNVGLHPVWIMFAILAGSKLFGFVGVVLGVPVVGTIAILLRFAIRQYKNSRYYNPVASHTHS